MGMVLFVVGLLVIVAAYVWFLFVAGQKSIVWAILCVFFPIASLYVLITEWSRAKNPFAVYIMGGVLLGLGATLSPSLRDGDSGRGQLSASSGAMAQTPPQPPPPPAPSFQPPPEDDRKWQANSFDGAVRVTQAPVGNGECLVEARRGDQLLWKSST